MTESRAYTQEEVREQLLGHIQHLCHYWATVKLTDTPDTIRERLDGLAFSILTMIDGCSGLPAFDLIPAPHEEDKAFAINEGENWYDKEVINECQLHELFSSLHKNV